MSKAKPYCCTTPSALCFCLGLFLVFYGAGFLLIALWPVLEGLETAFLLGSIGLACIVNAWWNRTFHCFITGPLFLLVGIALAVSELGYWSISEPLVWGIVLVVGGAALILEQRFAR